MSNDPSLVKYDADVARSYESDRRAEAHWKAEQAFVRKYVAKHLLGQVLDLPVGTGRFFEFYKGADNVIGVDISPHMLEMASNKAQDIVVPGLELMKADATSLPFESDKFDTIFCFRLVHLLPPEVLPRLFAELSRTLKGKLILQLYVPRRSFVRRVLGALAVPIFRKMLSASGNKKQKPWYHIKSYLHEERLITDLAIEKGLKLVRRHKLMPYEGSNVLILEFAK